MRDKMTQKEVAEAIGLSESSISMYERGERNPGFEELEAIADLFNVNMDDLLDRPSKQPSSRPVFSSLNRGKAGDALNEMGKLSKEEDEIIAAYIAFIKSKRGE